MNIFKEMMFFIKNLFNKQKEVKLIEAPKRIVNQDKKAEFIKSLKINLIEKKKKIETLTCDGDGLGIQKKISS